MLSKSCPVRTTSRLLKGGSQGFKDMACNMSMRGMHQKTWLETMKERIAEEEPKNVQCSSPRPRIACRPETRCSASSSCRRRRLQLPGKQVVGTGRRRRKLGTVRSRGIGTFWIRRNRIRSLATARLRSFAKGLQRRSKRRRLLRNTRSRRRQRRTRTTEGSRAGAVQDAVAMCSAATIAISIGSPVCDSTVGPHGTSTCRVASFWRPRSDPRAGLWADVRRMLFWPLRPRAVDAMCVVASELPYTKKVAPGDSRTRLQCAAFGKCKSACCC